MSIHRRFLALLPALMALAAPAAAQQPSTTRLELTIVEEGSGLPVEDVRVQVEGVRAPAWTDRTGRVRVVNVPLGERMVTVTRPGYTGERVRIGFGAEPVEGEVEIKVLPITLAPVEVVARQQNRLLRERNFYQRQRQGFGVFMTREEIERAQPIRTLDLFRRIRGFQVEYNPQGGMRLVSRRGIGSFGGGTCSPLVYLDGMRIFMEPGREDPSDIVDPEQIEAIEAYPGPATIPPELNATGSACAVVAIWTRNAA